MTRRTGGRRRIAKVLRVPLWACGLGVLMLAAGCTAEPFRPVFRPTVGDRVDVNTRTTYALTLDMGGRQHHMTQEMHTGWRMTVTEVTPGATTAEMRYTALNLAEMNTRAAEITGEHPLPAQVAQQLEDACRRPAFEVTISPDGAVHGIGVADDVPAGIIEALELEGPVRTNALRLVRRLLGPEGIRDRLTAWLRVCDAGEKQTGDAWRASGAWATSVFPLRYESTLTLEALRDTRARIAETSTLHATYTQGSTTVTLTGSAEGTHTLARDTGLPQEMRVHTTLTGNRGELFSLGMEIDSILTATATTAP